MKNNSFEAIGAVVGMIAIAVVLLGYPLMLLWNWLMPVIFGLPEITFWQAIGLNFLSTILFKSTTTIKKD
jgi:membrane protein required for beta-lactamase induction